MAVSGQRHSLAALYPGERTTGTHCTGGWVHPTAGLDTEAPGKISCLCRGSNLDRPVVQSVARHFTDWATRLLVKILTNNNSCYSVRMWIEVRATWEHVTGAAARIVGTWVRVPLEALMSVSFCCVMLTPVGTHLQTGQTPVHESYQMSRKYRTAGRNLSGRASHKTGFCVYIRITWPQVKMPTSVHVTFWKTELLYSTGLTFKFPVIQVGVNRTASVAWRTHDSVESPTCSKISIMVKCGVLFEVRTEFLNNI
jgi:hypothetical protein